MKTPLLLDGPGRVPKGSSESYRRLLERLYALSRGGSKMGLHRMAGLLEKLGHPERAFPSIHVAGSNGKGSTSAFLASILAQGGLRVGLFTSPHLVSLTERIQIGTLEHGLVEIDQDELLQAAARVEGVESGFADASFFEVLTALGLVAFQRAGVDVAIVEAGLGARLDSTRMVEAEVAVLTDLSLEHTAILGDTIEAIAREEGAVVRPRRPLVCADGPPEAMRVVDELVRDADADLLRIGEHIDYERQGAALRLRLPNLDVDEVVLPLLGVHQARNALLAATAAQQFLAEVLERPLDADTVRRGIARTRWPGRLEVFRSQQGPPIVLDGAQNPHAARALARALALPRFSAPRHFVFGVLQDKNVAGMVEELSIRASSFAVTRPGSIRARDPEELAHFIRGRFKGPVEPAESPADALASATLRAQADGGWVVVCGSLYLVGDIRAILLSESNL